MSLLSSPTYQLQPSAEQVALSTNYISDFDFLNQYLPDTDEKEVERYGDRTVAEFLRMVGAELPSNSDMIKWAEQGRLHTKYGVKVRDCGRITASPNVSARINGIEYSV